MYACMHACMYVCMYVCIYVCMHVYSQSLPFSSFSPSSFSSSYFSYSSFSSSSFSSSSSSSSFSSSRYSSSRSSCSCSCSCSCSACSSCWPCCFRQLCLQPKVTDETCNKTKQSTVGYSSNYLSIAKIDYKPTKQVPQAKKRNSPPCLEDLLCNRITPQEVTNNSVSRRATDPTHTLVRILSSFYLCISWDMSPVNFFELTMKRYTNVIHTSLCHISDMHHAYTISNHLYQHI